MGIAAGDVEFNWGFDEKMINVQWFIVSICILLVVKKQSWKMMEFVNGKDDIPYMKWKIKMFQTTNQNIVGGSIKYSNINIIEVPY